MKAFSSVRTLKPMRGLEMLSPERAEFPAPTFNDLLLESKLMSQKKRGSQIQIVKHRRELSWSTDTTIKYIPFSEAANYHFPERKSSTASLSHHAQPTQNTSNTTATTQSKLNKREYLPPIVQASFSATAIIESSKQTQQNLRPQRGASSNSNSNSIINNQEQDDSSRKTTTMQIRSNSSMSSEKKLQQQQNQSSMHLTRQSYQSIKRANLLKVSELYLRDSKQIEEIFNKKAFSQRQSQERLLTAKLSSKPTYSRYTIKQSNNNNPTQTPVQKQPQKQQEQQQQKQANFFTTPSTVSQEKSKKETENKESAATIAAAAAVRKKAVRNAKLRRAMLRYKAVVQFWKKTRIAIDKKKEMYNSSFSNDLKEAIPVCMTQVLQSCKDPLVKLFKEQTSLAYHLISPKKAEFKEKEKKLKEYSLDILSGIQLGMNRLNEKDALPYLKLLARRTHSLDFAPPNFWPEFVLKRINLNQFGEIVNINEQQREMIVLLFFITYGVFNRLVSPWLTLEVPENQIIAKNSQLILSVLFYALFDYLKNKNPLVKEHENQLKKFKDLQRNNPLIAYKNLVSIENETSEKAKRSEPAEDKIIAEQIVQNEGIIAGIASRINLKEIIEEDIEFKTKTAEYFGNIATGILSRSDHIYPSLKLNIFKLF